MKNVVAGFACVSRAARGRRRARSGAQAQPSDLDPQIVKLVRSVSEEIISSAILKKLESFGTRSTLSSQDQPDRGIGAARQWIFDEMKGYSPKLQVSFDTYMVAKQGRITRDVEVRNVMAMLPGRSPRRVYVSGHYDTTTIEGGQGGSNAGAPRDPNAPAPAASVDRARGRQSRARRERRRERDGDRDRAGARLQPERHRVRRDARLHVPRRRGAGV